MGIDFGVIGKAKVYDSGQYVLPGKYLAQVSAIKEVNSIGGDDFMVIELDIFESNNDERKPGDSMSQMYNFRHLSTAGNVRGMLMAMFQTEEKEDIDGEVAKEVLHEEQPLRGLVMKLDAFNKPTRAGNDFTVVKWTHGGAELNAAINEAGEAVASEAAAELRAKLGFDPL